ncbi:MAG: hypothetical protein ISR65_05095 [Bacteriovoracaceae bacterium]|nr:hypothetical protein [Bacteriovoracaceae bacterium]
MFKKHFLLYSSYLFLTWIVHLIIISIVVFFHFILKHDLAVIEEWISLRGYEILIMTKLISLYIAMKFVNLKNDTNHPLKHYLNKGVVAPTREILVVIIFLIMSIVYIGAPIAMNSEEIELISTLLSYVAVCVICLTDIIVLNNFREYFQLTFKSKLVRNLLFPIMFWLVHKNTFVYIKYFDSIIILHLFMCLIFSDWKKNNWTLPGIYIGLIVAPLASFLGHDWHWKQEYSPFIISSLPQVYEYTVLCLLVLVYLYVKSHNISELKTKLLLRVLAK